MFRNYSYTPSQWHQRQCNQHNIYREPTARNYCGEYLGTLTTRHQQTIDHYDIRPGNEVGHFYISQTTQGFMIPSTAYIQIVLVYKSGSSFPLWGSCTTPLSCFNI